MEVAMYVAVAIEVYIDGGQNTYTKDAYMAVFYAVSEMSQVTDVSGKFAFFNHKTVVAIATATSITTSM